MGNISNMSFSAITNKKIGLENGMDKLAGELNEVNKELAKRVLQGSMCRVGDDSDSDGGR
jgi:hypothetical protein